MAPMLLRIFLIWIRCFWWICHRLFVLNAPFMLVSSTVYGGWHIHLWNIVWDTLVKSSFLPKKTHTGGSDFLKENHPISMDYHRFPLKTCYFPFSNIRSYLLYLKLLDSFIPYYIRNFCCFNLLCSWLNVNISLLKALIIALLHLVPLIDLTDIQSPQEEPWIPNIPAGFQGIRGWDC